MLAYSTIDEISAQPSNLNGGINGWGFRMWHTNPGDETPHRQLIERFAAAYPKAGIELPIYYPYEDFVEATAVWDGGTISIYYETNFSYLSLWSRDRKAVASFRAALLPLT